MLFMNSATRILLILFVLTKIVDAGSAYSQSSVSVSFTIPQIALLDIESASGTNITISLNVPTEAGDEITSPVVNTNWMNYTACVASGATNKIVAQLTAGEVPPGTALKLLVGAYSGGGAGTFGTSAGTVTLTAGASDIISGIGGCYSGNGTNNGHQLAYSIEVTDYSQLRSSTYSPLTITFTMSSN
jgi:hypothetical protein